jgi:uncharacterized protein YbjT (DUF2867 family)
VANSPSFEDKAVLEFFEASDRNLLAAEATAGMRHHVALSVVGTERLLASGYFRAKMAQETLINNLTVPYTIVRAAQFFEFVSGIALSATDGADPPVVICPYAADSRTVVTDAEAGYFGTLVSDQSLAPSENPRLGQMRFEDWLSRSAPQGVVAS